MCRPFCPNPSGRHCLIWRGVCPCRLGMWSGGMLKTKSGRTNAWLGLTSSLPTSPMTRQCRPTHDVCHARRLRHFRKPQRRHCCSLRKMSAQPSLPVCQKLVPRRRWTSSASNGSDAYGCRKGRGVQIHAANPFGPNRKKNGMRFPVIAKNCTHAELLLAGPRQPAPHSQQWRQLRLKPCGSQLRRCSPGAANLW